jgi:hypothetical protein
MRCYRCNSTELVLAPLWPYERESYAGIEIVMRLCQWCGLEQNHYGDDEMLTPSEAAEQAPSSSASTGQVWFPVNRKKDPVTVPGDDWDTQP